MRTRTLGRWMGLAAAVLGLGGWVLAHLPGRELHGPDEVGNLILYLCAALPDLHITVEDMILAGDKIVCRWTIRGTNTGPFGGRPATGDNVS